MIDTLSLSNPIAVKADHQWQKGFLLSFFDNCDNSYRLDDDSFMFAHFRTTKNVTFYSDEKGVSNNKRPIYSFDEIFGSYVI